MAQSTDTRKLDKPTVLDLFCGAGGMSLGFQNAGCEILGGIDINIHAIKTYKKNFPNCSIKLEPQDIRNVSPEAIGLNPGEVNIIIGGPPCQVYSIVGESKLKSLGRNLEKDERNFLYKSLVKFVGYFQPFFFVMENVDRLRKKELFSTIMKDLENGYDRNYPGYKVQYKVLNAADYGVPQLRKRLFIVGTRRDLTLEFIFPSPNCDKYVSVGEAIADLLPLTPPYLPSLRSKTVFQVDVPKPYRCLPQTEYQQKMREQISKKDGPDMVLNHICRSHNALDLICFAMLSPGGKYLDLPEQMRRYRWDIFNDKYKRLPWDKPAWTLTAHMQKDCLAYIHPQQTRSISVREAARLQSFPDHFVFDAPMTKMFELIGNSVPPLLAEAIAQSLVEQLKKLEKF